MSAKILVIDDELDIRRLICDILDDEDYQSLESGDAETALKIVEEESPDLIILDIWLEGSGLDGIQLLQCIKKINFVIPVIMISGHGDIGTAVNAIKLGAFDFLEKPFNADRLLLIIKNALDALALRKENAELRRMRDEELELIGASSFVNDIRSIVERVSQAESRLLISGPAGSGKEVVARIVHAKSRRKNHPFIVLNCATMSPERMEEELFGIELAPTIGSTTIGIFEKANGGTLLLDEVSDMPLGTQGKIVRILQEQTFSRVGSDQMIKTDVRVFATTNKDLIALIQQGKFREDLFYRLNVVPITIPPLNERATDIPLLIEHFMDKASKETGVAPMRIGTDAMASLQWYDWPGNVRQLRNLVEWLLIMYSDSPDRVIHNESLPSDINSKSRASIGSNAGADFIDLSLRDAREIFEREYLKSQVIRFGGNISETAKFIGMERSALHRKLKSLGISG
ncbi:MAG: sigma-54 dependent transcriptional regulator [Rhodospirillaceae bacterium]